MREELVVRNVAKLVQAKTPRYEVGRGLSVEQARTLIAHAKADRLGEPIPRFHDMRHTCESLFLAEGALRHVVQQIVGHSAIDVTMTIYAHASLDEERTALRRLGDASGGPVAVRNGGQTTGER